MHRRLGVVVPARDEAQSLAPCLAALDRAAHVARSSLDIVVVLDACRDESAAVMAATVHRITSQVTVVQIDARSVGTARRVGMERLLDTGGAGYDWLATTDADSLVPALWFERQLRHRRAGAAMVAGSVRVATWGTRTSLRPRWEAAYAAKIQHIHGANLSFLRSAYLRSGGFTDAAYDEDVALVRAFEDAHERVVWAVDLPVTTSARPGGRAPKGFAAHLDHLASQPPAAGSCIEVA